MLLFGSSNSNGRYQIAGIENGKVFVLDTSTSEIWESTPDSEMRTNYFYPMRYDIQLKKNYSHCENLEFTVEEARDEKHATWWTLVQRYIAKKFF